MDKLARRTLLVFIAVCVWYGLKVLALTALMSVGMGCNDSGDCWLGIENTLYVIAPVFAYVFFGAALVIIAEFTGWLNTQSIHNSIFLAFRVHVIWVAITLFYWMVLVPWNNDVFLYGPGKTSKQMIDYLLPFVLVWIMIIGPLREKVTLKIPSVCIFVIVIAAYSFKICWIHAMMKKFYLLGPLDSAGILREIAPLSAYALGALLLGTRKWTGLDREKIHKGIMAAFYLHVIAGLLMIAYYKALNLVSYEVEYFIKLHYFSPQSLAIRFIKIYFPIVLCLEVLRSTFAKKAVPSR